MLVGRTASVILVNEVVSAKRPLTMRESQATWSHSNQTLLKSIQLVLDSKNHQKEECDNHFRRIAFRPTCNEFVIITLPILTRLHCPDGVPRCRLLTKPRRTRLRGRDRDMYTLHIYLWCVTKSTQSLCHTPPILVYGCYMAIRNFPGWATVHLGSKPFGKPLNDWDWAWSTFVDILQVLNQSSLFGIIHWWHYDMDKMLFPFVKKFRYTCSGIDRLT